MLAALALYYPQLLTGLGVTLAVATGSLILGLVIAMVCAPLSLHAPKWVKRVIEGYVALIRGLPELLVIFLIFYGGTVLLTKLVGRYVEVSGFVAGVVALSVVAGAYLTEILRGALQAVPHGQWEAGRALGLGPFQAFRHVVLPQMVMRALPGLGNQWLVILKDSALVSVVGLEELMRKSLIAAGATHEPLGFYLAAAVLYIGVTAVSTLFINRAEARLQPFERER
jgi:His/Glu/Gln/Arg/opine family amino acid ABC transporter permease subunit